MAREDGRGLVSKSGRTSCGEQMRRAMRLWQPSRRHTLPAGAESGIRTRSGCVEAERGPWLASALPHGAAAHGGQKEAVESCEVSVELCAAKEAVTDWVLVLPARCFYAWAFEGTEGGKCSGGSCKEDSCGRSALSKLETQHTSRRAGVAEDYQPEYQAATETRDAKKARFSLRL